MLLKRTHFYEDEGEDYLFMADAPKEDAKYLIIYHSEPGFEIQGRNVIDRYAHVFTRLKSRHDSLARQQADLTRAISEAEAKYGASYEEILECGLMTRKFETMQRYKERKLDEENQKSCLAELKDLELHQQEVDEAMKLQPQHLPVYRQIVEDPVVCTISTTTSTMQEDQPSEELLESMRITESYKEKSKQREEARGSYLVSLGRACKDGLYAQSVSPVLPVDEFGNNDESVLLLDRMYADADQINIPYEGKDLAIATIGLYDVVADQLYAAIRRQSITQPVKRHQPRYAITDIVSLHDLRYVARSEQRVTESPLLVAYATVSFLGITVSLSAFLARDRELDRVLMVPLYIEYGLAYVGTMDSMILWCGSFERYPAEFDGSNCLAIEMDRLVAQMKEYWRNSSIN